METIDVCLELLYVHREPAMKRRVLEFVLANADELERRPTWNEQAFIKQLDADCCELLEKVFAPRYVARGYTTATQHDCSLHLLVVASFASASRKRLGGGEDLGKSR